MEAVSALLLIDPQVTMLGPPDPVADAPRLLTTLRDLLARARAAGVPVVFVQHDGREGGEMAPGAPGWAIHPALVPREGEPVVHKRARDGFEGTCLREALDDLGARRLIAAGFQSELCLRSTCLRAAALGYDVVLVDDAHGTCDTEAEPAAAIVARVSAEVAAVGACVHACDVAFATDEEER